MNFAPVCCDWMSFRHEYAEPVEPRNAGRVMKIDRDGVIEWETQQWDQIKCASADTSIRVKCDGKTLRGMANIGRFGKPDNVTGLTVMQCVEKWSEVLRKLGYNVEGFGTRFNRKVTNGAGETLTGDSKLLEAGTYITRIDLAGNFEVSDYAALCSAAMVRRIGQKLPMAGKYGPTWGYDAKRSNWTKAKLYDKTAEQQGKRRSGGGATLARFEVQLGSEWLKREKLDRAINWKGDDMAQIIYGRFATPVFRDSVAVTDWASIPTKIRAYAVLWRDGVDVRTCFTPTSGGFYKVRRQLMEYGIDIGTPCNVLALTRHTRVVEVAPVSALRDAA